MFNLEIIDESVKEILPPFSLRVFEKILGTQLFFSKARRERKGPRERIFSEIFIDRKLVKINKKGTSKKKIVRMEKKKNHGIWRQSEMQ